MLGEFESNDTVVISDLEAGVGTLLRMEQGHADVVLVIAEPSAKSIEAARRGCEIASEHTPVVVIANRVREEADVEHIRAALGDHRLVVVPEDPSITRADKEGIAPIDTDPTSPGVAAIGRVAELVLEQGVTGGSIRDLRGQGEQRVDSTPISLGLGSPPDGGSQSSS